MYLVDGYVKEVKIIKKFLKTLIIIILILILIFVIVSKFIYKASLVKFGGIGALIVLTGSMEPTILPNEMIIIKEQEEYKENDVITFRDKFGMLITHRIIGINEENAITKGDNNNGPDEIISKDKIEGKVVLHSIVLGYIFLYILKPLIIIICLGYLLSFLKYIILGKIFLKLC